MARECLACHTHHGPLSANTGQGRICTVTAALVGAPHFTTWSGRTGTESRPKSGTTHLVILQHLRGTVKSLGITGLGGEGGVLETSSIGPKSPRSSKATQQHSQASDLLFSTFISDYLFVQSSVVRFAKGINSEALSQQVTEGAPAHPAPAPAPPPAPRPPATAAGAEHSPKLTQGSGASFLGQTFLTKANIFTV